MCGYRGEVGSYADVTYCGSHNHALSTLAAVVTSSAGVTGFSPSDPPQWSQPRIVYATSEGDSIPK
eukprot:gene14757-17436_t